MLAVAIWLVAMVLSLCVDKPIALWVAAHQPVDKNSIVTVIVKWPGVYWTTLCISALLLGFHRQHLRAAALPLTAGAIGGLAYLLIKWVVGRRRPVIKIQPFHFQPFIGGFGGLFHESGLCFPSGHTCLSFATAVSLTMLLPRWRGIWFLFALMVAAERVLENAHYVSDVVAGVGVGALSALLTRGLLNRYWPIEQTDSNRELLVGR
jgi:membrane-associated phospholipid phosphatase